MTKDQLSAFERAIISRIISNERPGLDITNICVTKRERTGAGMYIDLDGVSCVEGARESEVLGKGLLVKFRSDSPDAGAMLYLEKGAPRLLELYVHGYGDLPENLTDFELEYLM